MMSGKAPPRHSLSAHHGGRAAIPRGHGQLERPNPTSPNRPWINYRTLIPRLIDRPHAEEIIVLRTRFHHEVGHVSDERRIGPLRRGGVAPDDLVTGEIGILTRVPV